MSGKKEIRYVVRYSPYVKNYATVKKLSMRQFHRSASVPRQDFLVGLSNQKNLLPLLYLLIAALLIWALINGFGKIDWH